MLSKNNSSPKLQKLQPKTSCICYNSWTQFTYEQRTKDSRLRYEAIPLGCSVQHVVCGWRDEWLLQLLRCRCRRMEEQRRHLLVHHGTGLQTAAHDLLLLRPSASGCNGLPLS